MFTLEKTHPRQGIWHQEKETPTLKDNEILIKVRKTAICGTDVHIYKWDAWSEAHVPLGTTIGHEYVGTVEAIGKNVTLFSIGDRVTSEGHIVCHTCKQCLKKQYHLCPNTIGTGIQKDGAFAEYISIPEFNVIKMPENVSDNTMAILDPFGNAINTIFKSLPKTALTQNLSNDYSIVITGAGPIGIMAALALQYMNIPTTLLDINSEKIDLAKNMGVQFVEHSHNISSLNFNIGLEMSGSLIALNGLIQYIENGGNISLLGIPASSDVIDLHKIIFKEITLKGVYGREMFETWNIMSKLLGRGLNIDNVITHQFHYLDYQKAFETAACGRYGKVIINWD